MRLFHTIIWQFALKMLHVHTRNPNFRNSCSSVQIHIELKFQIEFVPQDTEELSFSISGMLFWEETGISDHHLFIHLIHIPNTYIESIHRIHTTNANIFFIYPIISHHHLIIRLMHTPNPYIEYIHSFHTSNHIPIRPLSFICIWYNPTALLGNHT